MAKNKTKIRESAGDQVLAVITTIVLLLIIFVVLMQEDFDFVVQLMSRMSLHLDILEKKLLHSMTLSAHHRIVMLLLELAEQTSHRTTNTATIFFTQQELSDMLSLSRQTVVVCLKNLQEKGIIKTSRGQIELCNLENLRQEIL